MIEAKIVKKLSEILETDIDHVVPAIKKFQKEIEEQEKQIGKLEKEV